MVPKIKKPEGSGNDHAIIIDPFYVALNWIRMNQQLFNESARWILACTFLASHKIIPYPGSESGMIVLLKKKKKT